MHLAIYAHPFDLDALRGIGGLARLRDLGFAEVAMATSYHDGRWLTPWHPAGRVRFLEDGPNVKRGGNKLCDGTPVGDTRELAEAHTVSIRRRPLSRQARTAGYVADRLLSPLISPNSGSPKAC